MILPTLAISVAAAFGALLRWIFGILFNPIFPTLPLGTLAANILGGFLMGIFMTIMKSYPFVPEVVRLAIATGFLGGLTTFSTFSGESVNLLTEGELFWASMHILSHVGGSILATFLGIYSAKLFGIGAL